MKEIKETTMTLRLSNAMKIRFKTFARENGMNIAQFMLFAANKLIREESTNVVTNGLQAQKIEAETKGEQ